jgi:hypothetical protein
MWVGSSHQDLKRFPEQVMDMVGYAGFCTIAEILLPSSESWGILKRGKLRGGQQL